jgi:AbrB family looped-hinge helix DNA binding protein
MRATGIVRRIDDLGRVVIPKELRRTMGIAEGDPLEIFTTTDKKVVLQKYHEGEPEKNDLEVSTEPKEEEGIKITIQPDYDTQPCYLVLSKSASELFHWLKNYGCFHDDVHIHYGHEIEVTNFLEKGD